MRVVLRSELSSEIRRHVIMFIRVIDSRLCEVLDNYMQNIYSFPYSLLESNLFFCLLILVVVIIMKMVQSNSEDLVVSGSSRSHSDRLQESDVHIRLPASMFHEKGI